MKFEVIYHYDFWNNRESSELYSQTFQTGVGWKGLSVGERLNMYNDRYNRSTAVLTEVQEICENVYILKTNRSVTVIRKL